jgi:hypothetical protein
MSLIQTPRAKALEAYTIEAEKKMNRFCLPIKNEISTAGAKMLLE